MANRTLIFGVGVTADVGDTMLCSVADSGAVLRFLVYPAHPTGTVRSASMCLRDSMGDEVARSLPGDSVLVFKATAGTYRLSVSGVGDFYRVKVEIVSWWRRSLEWAWSVIHKRSS